MGGLLCGFGSKGSKGKDPPNRGPYFKGSLILGTQKAHKHKHFFRDIPTFLGWMKV